MIRGFRQIAFLTLISRILGMVRDIAFAYYFGAGVLMTAWTMGFKIPNLSRRLFGEGAASASFIPVYTHELHENPRTAARLAGTVVTVLLTLLGGIVVLGEMGLGVWLLFADQEGARMGLSLAMMMLPYMIAICMVAILAGILNVHRHFAAPAAAPIVLNVFIISGLLVTGMIFQQPERQVYWVAGVVLLAGAAQLLLQMAALRRTDAVIEPGWDVKSAPFRRILVFMGPMILGLTVTQLNTLADDLIALAFSNDEGRPLSWGAVSYLYYAQRLYQFPLGVLGISLATAIFPVMSADAVRKDYEGLQRTISRGLRSAIFVAIPATAGLFLVARPLVATLFEHGQFQAADTAVTAWTLAFYAVGLLGYFSQQLASRAFYSTHDSKTPAITAAVAVVVNILLNLTLIWPMGTAGLALSTAICSYLQVVIMLRALRRRYGSILLEGIGETLVKTLIGTGAMILAGLGVLSVLGELPVRTSFDLLRLGAVVGVCSLVYLIAAILLRNDMLGLITGRTRRP